MAVIPLFRDLLAAGWAEAWPRHTAYWEGLAATYGPELFGPSGPAGMAAWLGPALSARLAAVAHLDWEGEAARWLELSFRLLPGPPPNVYLATLFFLAPAATIAVAGLPAITVGLERFAPLPGPLPPPRFDYCPAELAEMIPHEAAHAVRMRALDLPPTPRQLTLREMLLLEGTALLFTDALLGRETLRSFVPAPELARHEAQAPALLAAAAPELDAGGMEVFTRYFGAGGPVNGYCLGRWICRQYAARTGTDPAALVTTPTAAICREVGLP